MKSVKRKSPKVGFVSLGCPKALVDSERILTRLRAEGYEVAASYGAADLVLVNTCGFIDAAVDESLDAIGEALAENGKVIVTGCLGAQPQKILDRHPQVLKITGPQRYEEVVAAVHEYLPAKHEPFLDLVPEQGIRLTPRHYAYLKISEGCNHRCSFCIIPSMRGDLVSRPIGEVLREAEQLVRAGVKEILVISQDTSAYGVDLKYAAQSWRNAERRARFYDLSAALGELGVWIRLHYVYPYPHVDQVIELMAQGKVLPYLDIPFQHASSRILKLMKRPAAAENTLERIAAWRRVVPDITIRSTFIVGFPGETEQDFQQLLDWLRVAQLDRVGCFEYSPVEGAAANALQETPVPAELKAERRARFMELAAEISAQRLEGKIGRTMPVLIDRIDGDVAIGRSSSDAPEIDGTVRIAGARRAGRALSVGSLVDVQITAAGAYDLEARLIDHTVNSP
ncbi:MAG: ribosomal protein methylthiotransferase [Gammaproteobacteria bacterium]|nr:rimO [Gammaproteobacteria bacterium]MEA3142146.1 ribosomal protein methylthiotransferase [Gammaproteobacteria bacterium]